MKKNAHRCQRRYTDEKKIDTNHIIEQLEFKIFKYYLRNDHLYQEFKEFL